MVFYTEGFCWTVPWESEHQFAACNRFLLILPLSLPLLRVTLWFRRTALDHHLHFHTPLFVCLCVRVSRQAEGGGGGLKTLVGIWGTWWRGGDHHQGSRANVGGRGCVGRGGSVFAVNMMNILVVYFNCRGQQRIVCLVLRNKLEYKYQNICWTFKGNLATEEDLHLWGKKNKKKTTCSNI